jgi:hypothetical protein
MIRLVLYIAAAATMAGASYAQTYVGPMSPSNLGTTPYTATGGTASRTLAARAADVKNAADYGAKCDGSTDDAAAINAAVAAIRSNTAVGGTGSWPIGHAQVLRLPAGRCVINSSLNFTGLYGSGFVADFWGSAIVCQTNGTPCIDATGSGQIQLNGINVYGTQTNAPNIGLSVGRITNNGVGADHMVMEHPVFTGYFTVAPYFNNQSETTVINGGWFTNWSPNAYGAIFDGSNHFNVQSAFTGQTYPADTYYSFNENTCNECIFGVFGANSVPLWIGGTARHRFANAYVYYSSTTPSVPGPAVQLFFGTNATAPLVNEFLDLDAHFEDFGGQHNLNAIIQFVGATSTPVVYGLHMRDNYLEQSGPIFSRGTGVTSVTLQNADLEIGTLAGVSPSWWDSASAYTVSGRIYSKDGTYVTPGTFTGTSCVGASCTNTIVLPSNIVASQISNTGGVASVTVGGSNNYGYGTSVPSCTFSAPPSGGQQATCAINYFSVNGYGFLDGTNGSAVGTGYTAGDTLTCPGGTVYSGGSAITIVVDTIGAGGSIATWHGANFSSTKYSVTPGEPCSLTGGTGSGAKLAAGSWKILAAAVSITSAGAGYTTAPTVTLGTAPCANGPCGSSFAATLTATLSSTMTLSAGAGQILLDGTGTKLGVSGSSGSPALMVGALIDNSGVRQSLTGNYTVPQNTSLVRFTQSSTVASSTITLPTAFADGQPVQFVNYAGAITALTFSPSVNGWTNGSTLAANTGLRVRWDATAAAWYREQ